MANLNTAYGIIFNDFLLSATPSIPLVIDPTNIDYSSWLETDKAPGTFVLSVFGTNSTDEQFWATGLSFVKQLVTTDMLLSGSYSSTFKSIGLASSGLDAYSSYDLGMNGNADFILTDGSTLRSYTSANVNYQFHTASQLALSGLVYNHKQQGINGSKYTNINISRTDLNSSYSHTASEWIVYSDALNVGTASGLNDNILDNTQNNLTDGVYRLKAEATIRSTNIEGGYAMFNSEALYKKVGSYFVPIGTMSGIFPNYGENVQTGYQTTGNNGLVQVNWNSNTWGTSQSQINFSVSNNNDTLNATTWVKYTIFKF